MSNFKYIVGQLVKIKSLDKNLNGMVVKIVTRAYGQWADKEVSTNTYKVIGLEPGIVEYIPFYEGQLEEINWRKLDE